MDAHEWGSQQQLATLSSFKTIFCVAVPAALFRVSGVLSSTLQTSLVSRHGGADLLAAFAAVGVTTKTACLLFAFFADGVAAKVGRSAAQEAPQALRTRVRLYLASCLVLGAATSAVLLGTRGHILRPFHLRPAVHELAGPFWTLLSLLLPLALLNMAISGTLQGLQRVGLSAALEAASAAAEVAGAYVVLTSPRLRPGAPRLRALALVGWGVAGAHLAVGGTLVAVSLPPHAQQAQRATVPPHHPLRTPLLAASAPSAPAAAAAAAPAAVVHRPGPSGRALAAALIPRGAGAGTASLVAHGSMVLVYLRELAQDGSNVAVRSILVQGSMWLTAVAAARLGTAPLAAHQILTQLWMLPTHFSGGFAVAGIVLGSRLALGPGLEGAQEWRVRQAQRRLSLRLLLLSSLLGAAVGCVLAVYKPAAVASFHPNAEVAAALRGPAWAMLCTLQPLTSALFTLTGLIYGAQYFAFMRNILLAGFVGLFCPSLLWVMREQAAGAAGLGAAWRVKLAFYAWQAVAEGAGVARAYGHWGCP